MPVDSVALTWPPGWSQQRTLSFVSQGERTQFDRFVDLNVRGAKRRIYSDLRIYRN